MARSFLLPSFAAVAVISIGVPSAAAPIDDIIAAERAFAADSQEQSLKTTFSGYAADHGVALRPTGIFNVQQYLTGWPNENDAGAIQWGPAFAGVAASGDLGFTTGPAVGGFGRGTYLTVWERQSGGEWRWLIDLGADSPLPQSVGIDGDVMLLRETSVAPQDPDRAWRDLSALDGEIDGRLAEDSAALADHLADDSRLIGLEAEAAVGRAAWIPALAARPAMVARHEGGGVSAAGDFGWTYGYAHWREGDATRHAPYLRIWQRRPDGWVIVIDNLPPFPN